MGCLFDLILGGNDRGLFLHLAHLGYALQLWIIEIRHFLEMLSVLLETPDHELGFIKGWFLFVEGSLFQNELLFEGIVVKVVVL